MNFSKKYLKQEIKNLVNKIFPKTLLLYLMEKNYTNLGFETSNACNANCSFCAYKFMKRKPKVISNELTYKVAKNYNDDGGGTINFTPVVGDPLVDKNLLNKIRECKKMKNINDIFLYTNGIYLDRFDLDDFCNSGLSRISISTYIGNKNGYKKYYGVDQYDRVIKNIKNLLKKNSDLGSPISIFLHLRVDLPKESWEMNKDYLFIRKYIDKGRINYLTNYDSWSGQISSNDIPKGCSLKIENTKNSKDSRQPCFEMYRRIQVLSDGRVGVCVCRDVEAEIVIGDIKKNTVNEIWNGELLKKYRSNWKKGVLPDVCKSCNRYQPINKYINNNAYSIVITHLKRFKRKLSV